MNPDDSLEGLDDLLQSAWGGGKEPAPGEQPGDLIDRYKLLEELGEGGMGSVWMAEQKEPVQRKVALKIIKLGMDTREVVVRFEAERQALALMDHPHIAKVLDGGATATGRPYFVMELVRGTPITEYCDRAKAGLRERLELFTKVCAAVQHAHQKGIIHRDLKPGNVLVTLHDGVPVPKVIDFGIAKATSAELTQKTMFTRHAQLLGTPEYMAPEQAELSGLDIDTRADVYSLGVLLYELLTGTKPFDMRTVLEKGYEELLRTIREDEPAKPSTRVSTLGESASPIASGRQVNVETLSKRLKGDLDWVVMKALEKDRTRRYATASGFSDDVARYLRDEPVAAAPPSAAYRVRKFVRRRRKTVAAAAALTFAILAGIVGTSFGLVWALNERDRADRSAADARAAQQAEAEARSEAEAKAEEARDEARRAEHELARATEARRFIRKMLGGANPSFARGRDTTLMREVLDDAAARLEAGEVSDEVVEAEVRLMIGATLAGLSEHALAEPHLRASVAIRRRVLGDDDPYTLDSINSLALLLQDAGKLDAAELLFREGLAGYRRVLGDDHPQTLVSIDNLGGLLRVRSDFDAAETYYREALEARRRVLGNDDLGTVTSNNNLATVLQDLGRLDEAEPYCREALDGVRRIHGEDHPDTLTSIQNLGALLANKGDLDAAEPYFREALEGKRRVLGDDHPSTLMTISNLGALLHRMGKLDAAEPYFREALASRRRVLGDDHPYTLMSIFNVGALLQLMGELDGAEPYFREVLAKSPRVLGDDHPYTLETISNLGGLLRDEAANARQGGSEGHLGRSLADLGAFELRHGSNIAAEPLLTEALELLAASGAEESRLTQVRSDLGAVLSREGRYAEAEPLLEESARWMLAHPEDPATGVVLQHVVELYEAWHTAEPERGLEGRVASWHEHLDAWRAEHAGTDSDGETAVWPPDEPSGAGAQDR